LPTSISLREPFHEAIELGLRQGLSGVKRFVRKLRGSQPFPSLGRLNKTRHPEVQEILLFCLRKKADV